MVGDEIDQAIQEIATEEPEPKVELMRLKEISDSLLEPELAVHIVENAHSAIVIARKDGTVFYINREAEFIFGYARQELIGKHIHKLVPERLRADHDRMFARWLEKPAIRPFTDALNTTALHKDGTEMDVAIALLPVVIPAGFFIVAVVRKKLENER